MRRRRSWTSRRSGYELVHHGPGRWNGVAIASRVGIADAVAGIPDAGRLDR